MFLEEGYRCKEIAFKHDSVYHLFIQQRNKNCKCSFEESNLITVQTNEAR